MKYTILIISLLITVLNAKAVVIAPDAILGPDTVCFGQTETYSVQTPQAGYTYHWIIDHGVYQSGSAANNTSVDYDFGKDSLIAGKAKIRVWATDGLGFASPETVRDVYIAVSYTHLDVYKRQIILTP